MEMQSPLRKLLIWRLRNIPHKQFTLMLSVVVGVICGVCSAVLKTLVHYIQHLLTLNFDIQYSNYLYLAYPLIGILLTVIFIRKINKEALGNGIARLLFSISKKSSLIGWKKTYSYLVSSTFTVGFGGSLGLEAPIVATGSSIASNLGRLFHMNYKTNTLLIGCGAAGAIAAIFNAPIAGAIFAMEVLMLDLTMSSLIPLVLASIAGAVTAQILYVDSIRFSFPIKDVVDPYDLLFYVALGLATGIVSIYLTKTHLWSNNIFDRLKNPYWRAVAGGTLIGVLIFIFPPLFGDGYGVIKSLLAGNTSDILNSSPFYFLNDSLWHVLLFMFLTMVFKVIATTTTMRAGGVGGYFAPALFLGGMAGNMVAKVINYTGLKEVSEANFTLVGMAGILAGVQHAPLTAIFLIAEITGGYELFLPLMITASTSYLFAKTQEPHSIYTKELHKIGALITHDKDKAVLTLMKLDKLIETNFSTIQADMNLGQMVGVVSKSKRNIFPVVNKDGVLEGIVGLDDIRGIMFDPEKYESVVVYDIMRAPEALLDCNETMEDVMEKFKSTGAWNLPVMKEGKYQGFMSKSKLFSAYRQILLQFSQE